MEALWVHGMGTFAVLLGSWLAICLPLELLDRSSTLRRWRCQPGARRSSATERTALALVAKNWALLLIVLPLAAPLLAHMFPRAGSLGWPTL